MRELLRPRRCHLLVVLAIVGASACAHGLPRQLTPAKPLHPTKAQRIAAIQHAQIWRKTDVSATDLRAGPQGRGALAPLAAVTCDYVEQKMEGTSPKFTCALAPGDDVKVKYGADNVEVYGVVAASRLLWALGFGADRWYPVSVTCHGCPANPAREIHRTDADVTFDVAAIERKMPGKTIETVPDEGWSWPELELVDPEAGGASFAQRDALKLLAAMIQHTDSKPEQQRLICLAGREGEACDAPFMFIHDVGLTFGKANRFNRNSVSGVNLNEWSKQAVWKDAHRCVAEMPKSRRGTLADPVIGEAGRKFLADLLVQLSDAQLRDLFEVSRLPQHSHTPVEAWIAVFKTKRDAIVNATCR
jgi:hypothetical protein